MAEKKSNSEQRTRAEHNPGVDRKLVGEGELVGEGKAVSDMSSREPLTLADKAAAINRQLTKMYPDAHCELNFRNPLELTVATVLSAQTTDKRVNEVTPALFAKYQTARDYARANPADIEKLIHPLGLAPSKAKRLVGMGEKLMADFDGQVPSSLAALTSLPGVGRKTALVVRGNAFDLPGLAVDTHVKRVSTRLGLTFAHTERAIEDALCALVPESEWTQFSHRVIFHGRRVCTAKSPNCVECPLAYLCDYVRD